jgi:hypothetical protein
LTDPIIGRATSSSSTLWPSNLSHFDTTSSSIESRRTWFLTNNDFTRWNIYNDGDTRKWEELEDVIQQVAALDEPVLGILLSILREQEIEYGFAFRPRSEVHASVVQEAIEIILRKGRSQQWAAQLQPWLKVALHCYLRYYQSQQSRSHETEVIDLTGPETLPITATKEDRLQTKRKHPSTSDEDMSRGTNNLPVSKKAKQLDHHTPPAVSSTLLLYDVDIHVLLHPDLKGVQFAPSCIPICIATIVEDAFNEYPREDIHAYHLSWRRFIAVVRDTLTDVDVDRLQLTTRTGILGSSLVEVSIDEEGTFRSAVLKWVCHWRQTRTYVPLVMFLKNR